MTSPGRCPGVSSSAYFLAICLDVRPELRPSEVESGDEMTVRSVHLELRDGRGQPGAEAEVDEPRLEDALRPWISEPDHDVCRTAVRPLLHAPLVACPDGRGGRQPAVKEVVHHDQGRLSRGHGRHFEGRACRGHHLKAIADGDVFLADESAVLADSGFLAAGLAVAPCGVDRAEVESPRRPVPERHGAAVGKHDFGLSLSHDCTCDDDVATRRVERAPWGCVDVRASSGPGPVTGRHSRRDGAVVPALGQQLAAELEWKAEGIKGIVHDHEVSPDERSVPASPTWLWRTRRVQPPVHDSGTSDTLTGIA